MIYEVDVTVRITGLKVDSDSPAGIAPAVEALLGGWIPGDAEGFGFEIENADEP